MNKVRAAILFCLFLGVSIAADVDIAELKAKAERGDPEAQTQLGISYHSGGAGMLQDGNEAMKWFRKAADQGYADGQFNLGKLYLYGLYNSQASGVPKNEAEALGWLRKAADQGHIEAHLELCEIYWGGMGVPKDNKEAMNWLRKAAELGESGVQFQVAMKYLKGLNGVPKDQAEALKWFHRASNQGLSIAQASLAYVYLGNEGVPKDEVEAYYWHLLAGPKEVGTKAIDEAAVKLTPKQKAEVQRRVAEFRPVKEVKPAKK